MNNTPEAALFFALRILIPTDNTEPPEGYPAVIAAIETLLQAYYKSKAPKPEPKRITPTVFFWEYNPAGIPVWGCKYCQSRWPAPAPVPCPKCGTKDNIPLPPVTYCPKCCTQVYGYTGKCPDCSAKLTTQAPITINPIRNTPKHSTATTKRLQPNISTLPDELLTIEEVSDLEARCTWKIPRQTIQPIPAIVVNTLIMRRWEVPVGTPVFIVERDETGGVTLYIRSGSHKAHRVSTVAEDVKETTDEPKL